MKTEDLTLKTETPTALFVSPHLDDAAFSCGGTLARWAQAGGAAHLATVFTASVPNPTGFALACQLDKGLEADVDYMALRRAEDRAATGILGAQAHHLPHAEAPHRGYDAAEALFAGVRDGDDVQHAAQRSLAALVNDLAPDLLFAPQGIGGHVDREQTIRALRALPPAAPICWYRDAPYVFRHPEAAPANFFPEALTTLCVDVADTLDTKADAAAAYTSQLGFQFGGESPMRDALAAFAEKEAPRTSDYRFAECFACAPEDAEATRALFEAAAISATFAGVRP